MGYFEDIHHIYGARAAKEQLKQFKSQNQAPASLSFEDGRRWEYERQLPYWEKATQKHAKELQEAYRKGWEDAVKAVRKIEG